MLNQEKEQEQTAEKKFGPQSDNFLLTQLSTLELIFNSKLSKANFALAMKVYSNEFLIYKTVL